MPSIDYDADLAVLNESCTIAEAARKLGKNYDAVAQFARRARKKGFTLKSFPPGRPTVLPKPPTEETP